MRKPILISEGSPATDARAPIADRRGVARRIATAIRKLLKPQDRTGAANPEEERLCAALVEAGPERRTMIRALRPGDAKAIVARWAPAWTSWSDADRDALLDACIAPQLYNERVEVSQLSPNGCCVTTRPCGPCAVVIVPRLPYVDPLEAQRRASATALKMIHFAKFVPGTDPIRHMRALAQRLSPQDTKRLLSLEPLPDEVSRGLANRIDSSTAASMLLLCSPSNPQNRRPLIERLDDAAAAALLCAEPELSSDERHAVSAKLTPRLAGLLAPISRVSDRRIDTAHRHEIEGRRVAMALLLSSDFTDRLLPECTEILTALRRLLRDTGYERRAADLRL